MDLRKAWHILPLSCVTGDVVLVQIQVTQCSAWDHSSWGQRWRLIHSMQKIIFCPDFADIPEETAKAAKFMIISYPANPVCSVADDSFYEKAIAFAKKYNVILLHDNAYSDIIFGGKEGKIFPVLSRSHGSGY